LDGTSLPIIFAELPGTDLVSSRTFDIVTPVTVLRIGADAFANNFISRPVFEKLLNTVRNSIHNQNTKPKPPRREIAGPIRVLFLAANPVTTGRLRIDQEAREIEEKLQRSGERDKIELITRWAVRFEDLQRCLLEFKPHIVHFSGHGTNENELVVEDRAGAPRVLEQETLLELFDALRNNIRVVILNACYSVVQATAITGVIDCAIGMTNKIGDQAAIAFAASFYQALAYGETIATAHRLGNLALKREAKQKDADAVLVKAEGVDVAQITIVG
jgi:CHAT domain-containing protein